MSSGAVFEKLLHSNLAQTDLLTKISKCKAVSIEYGKHYNLFKHYLKEFVLENTHAQMAN